MEKDSLINRLSTETGLTPRRCKSLLERYNFDYEKTCQNEIVKSARKNHTETTVEKPSVQQKENIEDKQLTKTDKTEKASEKPSEPRKSRKSKVVQQTIEKPSERKKRGSKAVLENSAEESSEKEDETKNETASSSKPHTETRTHGGLTFQVNVVAGHDYFGDKEIHSDQSGFYHPFATMKDIIEWKTKYLKKTNAFETNKK